MDIKPICPNCKEGHLYTEWHEDRFPKQWVYCTHCEIKGPSVFAPDDIFDAFKEAMEMEGE